MLTPGPLCWQIRLYDSSQLIAVCRHSAASHSVCHTNTACTAPVLDAVELALASLPLTSLCACFSFPSAAYLWFLHINKYIK